MLYQMQYRRPLGGSRASDFALQRWFGGYGVTHQFVAAVTSSRIKWKSQRALAPTAATEARER